MSPMFVLLGVLLSLVPVARIETSEPVVVLTFDACATRRRGYEFDRAVFEALRREQIPATIFVSGRWVEAHPEATKELAAEPLLEFGNHSWDHQKLPRLKRAALRSQIERTERILERTVGRRSVAVRPPYGDWSQRVLETVRAAGLPFVTWDVASGDPSDKATVAGMVEKVLREASAGSIVVFHINGRGHGTADAVPLVAKAIRARGLRLVKLSELLASGAKPNAPGLAQPSTTPVAVDDCGAVHKPRSHAEGPSPDR